MIHEATRNDFPRLQEIADICYGKNFLDYSSFRQPICITYKVNDQIVGFATASVGFPSLLGYRVATLLPREEAGILCNICVLPEFSGLGIGTKLTAERCRRLETQVPRIIATAWKQYPNGTVNAAVTLGRNGFEVVGEIQTAFVGLPCIVCGPSCKCGIVLYARKGLLNVSNETNQQGGIRRGDGAGEKDSCLLATVEAKHSGELIEANSLGS